MGNFDETASSIILHPTFIYRLTSLYAEEKKIGEYLFSIGPNVIAYTHAKRKTELSNGTAVDDDDTKSAILIDKLLELEENGLMDRQRILDQINTFIVAVSENAEQKMHVERMVTLKLFSGHRFQFTHFAKHVIAIGDESKCTEPFV